MGEGQDIWKEGGEGMSCDMMWLRLPVLEGHFSRGSTVDVFYSNGGNFILCFSIL
jgi:hypothetical protein